MRTRLSHECFDLIERPALQHQCYHELEALNNLAYEMTKTTKLDEVDRIKKAFNIILDKVKRIEKDIAGHF